MSLRLDGINPLAYMGVKPVQPPNLMIRPVDPTANDFQNINVGTFWLVYPDQRLWILISVVGGTATWVQLYPGGGGGGGTTNFPCDTGTAIEVGGVVNVFGDGNVVTHGAGNTITLSMAGDFIENFDTDSGTAHPSSNTIRILGGTNINTAGSGNTVTVNLDNSVSLTGTLGVSGNTTLDSAVTLSSLTDGVLQTNGVGTVSATNGTDGQLLIGGGTAPVWANLTSLGGTVIITDGPNSINLESTGGGGGSPISFYAFQATDYLVPQPGVSSQVAYPMGSANVLSVNFNNGGAFFPGDGLGTPASFTAPVTGSYYFAFNVVLRAGTSPNNNINTAYAQIVTSASTQTYSGTVSNNNGGAPLNYTYVQAQSNTTLQLTAGTVVTFQPVVAVSGGIGGTAYIVSGLRGIGGSFVPTTVTSIEGFLVSASSGGGGGGAGSVAFYGYQATGYQVPLIGTSGTVPYTWGTGVAFTTTVNEGAAFYPGDGSGTPATFTAPVNGIYYLEAAGQFRAGSTNPGTVALIYSSVQIVTPGLVYAGVSGQPGGSVTGPGPATWYGPPATDQSGNSARASTVVQLNAGDAITFTSAVSGSATQTPAPGKYSHVVAGLMQPIPSSGTTCPVTYVQGYLLKEL